MTALIRTAVFPVAGFGTRFLPATKAIPKEMLPIVDKPLIQFAVEEAAQAGITRMVFVTSRHKGSIGDHFDSADELERVLADSGKTRQLEAVRNALPPGAHCIFVLQDAPRGLGHAVHCARAVTGDAPFAVVLADDLIINAGPGCLRQMVDAYAAHKASVIAVEDVPRADTGKYGIVSVAAGTDAAGASVPISSIVEKPAPEQAPSTLAVVGRYVLSPAIFALLEQTGPGSGGEIQLTDAIAALMDVEPVHALRFAGTRYDCGSKLGFLKATVDLAMSDADTGEEFARHIAALRGTGG